MGDPDKNAAWDLLCEAKEAVRSRVRRHCSVEASARAAERQLALCESSDWFWWFGDYNPPHAVSQFDQLYRRQLVGALPDAAMSSRPRACRSPSRSGSGAPEQAASCVARSAG